METTVFNIINEIQQFHSDLANYYFAQKESTYNTRIHSLLDYLGRSERYLEKYVDTHRLELSRETLKTTITIPSESKYATLLNLEKKDLPDILDDYQRAMSFAIRMDAMLINFCKLIKEEASDPQLTQAFKNLCRVTRKEKRNLYTYNNIYAD